MKYRTIVADPPWRYDVTTPRAKNGNHGGVERQYQTMDLDEIAGLPVRGLADRDAHLYLWVTNPFLFEARWIAEAWGFRYVTLLTWHKLTEGGMGYYFRGATEHVLFGVRGTLPIPVPLRVPNHFAAPRTGHSSKPDRLYEIVERVSPEPRLEMFARRRRVGWDVWGDEAPPESEARTQTHMGLTA